MKENNKIWLQVPTEIVRNIGFKIDEKSFAIYAYLLFRKFKDRDRIVKVFLGDIKMVTSISDNRTIKKCLLELYNQNLVKNNIKSLPVNKPLEIIINEPYKKDFFTQLPLDLLKNIRRVKLTGFRLMYYYKSYINSKDMSKQYCYPSYETIQADLGISNFSVTKYNKLLVEEKLLTITKHKVEYDPFGDSGLERFNNHYSLNLHRL